MTRSGNAHYGKRTLVSLFNVCFLHTHTRIGANKQTLKHKTIQEVRR